MPQLDLTTYTGVIVSLTFVFFFLLVILVQYFLPIILTKFLSLKKMNSVYTDFQAFVHHYSMFLFIQEYKFYYNVYQIIGDYSKSLTNSLLYCNILFVEKAVNSYIFGIVEERA